MVELEIRDIETSIYQFSDRTFTLKVLLRAIRQGFKLSFSVVVRIYKGYFFDEAVFLLAIIAMATEEFFFISVSIANSFITIM